MTIRLAKGNLSRPNSVLSLVRFFVIYRIIAFFILFWGLETALAQPVASFSASPRQGCNPLKVDYTNTSTNAVSYLWDFGNGNQSTLKSPGAVYNNAGKYTVTLIATDASGKKDTVVMKDHITVFKSPVADLQAAKFEICSGDNIPFSDQSTPGDGAINKYKWDFGEGGTSTSKNPTYTYTTSGLFDVTLIITDANGCQSSVKKTRYITVNALPSVTFTQDNAARCKAPLDVNFSSTSSGKTPLKFLWQFGDGGTSTDENPQHTYNNSGSYDVTLNVTDAKGCIRKIAKASLIQIKPPTADFDADKRSICPGQTVHFQNKSTPLTGTGTSYWEFENGTTSTDREPDVVFTSPGTYKVYLKYSWDGCDAEITRKAFITVNDLPKGKISPQDTTVCHKDGASVKFKVSGSNLVTADWETDGDLKENLPVASFHKEPTNTNGKYLVKAYGITAKGCRALVDSVWLTVRGPIAGITLDSNGGCIPRTVNATFSGSSKDPLKSYKWTGPEGETGTSKDFSFNLKLFGLHQIYQQVEDINGCKDDTTAPVKGGIHINVDFSKDTNRVCYNALFTIYNHSSKRRNDTVVFHYDWHNQNGPAKDSMISESMTKTVFQMRSQPGSIDTLSIIADSYGCKSYLPKEKEPIVLILGPKVGGTIKTFCSNDSISGLNTSTYYTRTYWQYIDEFGQKQQYTPKPLNRKLSTTNDLWIYAYNDTGNCRDSLMIQTRVDPTPLKFTYTFDCNTRKFVTTNQYNGLQDTQYIWKVTNTTRKESNTYRQKNISVYLDSPGLYTIKLSVINPAYTCSTPSQISLRVFPKLTGIASATVDRINCYPVKLTLKDPLFDKWKSAYWQLGSTTTVPDSAGNMVVTHNDNQDNLQVTLKKTDSTGCQYSDDFYFKITGFKAYINTTQNDISCVRSDLTLYSILLNPQPATFYTYIWDMGYRTSYKERDTMQVYGWKKVPVSLTIKDDKGCESKDQIIVTVQNSSPKADFVASETKATCPPLDVFFTDLSVAGKYPIVKRYWQFGDGTYSEKINPGKLYIYSGRYSVSLKVTNSQGCEDSVKIPDLVVVNGPTGTYTFDKKYGCTPLQVNLNTKTQGAIKKFEFDMGDGAVLDTSGKLHLYTRPGTYIPRLILTDTTGCRFSPPPKDTIHVYPVPVAMFAGKKVCDNSQYTVQHQSDWAGEIPKQVRWKVPGKPTVFNDSLNVVFGSPGTKLVELQVETTHGCADSIVRPFYAYGIHPELIKPSNEFCLGQEISLVENSTADTSIVSRKLWLDGIAVPITTPIEFPAGRKGKIPAVLIISDAMGCSDTLLDNGFLKVGDTLPPPPLAMLRSTVLDDYSTESRFRMTQEPDFKDYRLYLYRGGAWQLSTVSTNPLDTNLSAGGLNTLQNSYCHRILQANYCDKTNDPAQVINQCTIETKALGDTNKARVWWRPYGGWNEIEKYRIYRKISGNNSFVLIDSVSGQTLNYTDTSVYCHVTYDYRIEGVEKQGNLQLSFSDTAHAIPIHVQSVPPPEIWRTTVDTNLFTHTEWKMVKPVKFPIQYYTVYRQKGSGWDMIADNLTGSGLMYLADHQTNVQGSFYTYAATATDVCQTQSQLSNPGRSILLNIKQEQVSQLPVLTWNPYIHWNEGVQEYVVERKGKNGIFYEVSRTGGTDTTYTDHNIPFWCDKDFVYRVTAIRNQPANWPDSTHNVKSQSNWSEFVPEMKFFIPNAFTPDQNLLNDKFRPDGIYVYSYHMNIYNRYGQKLFEGTECRNSWDGNYEGEPAPDGVYAYYIEAWDMKGKQYNFRGTVHLMR